MILVGGGTENESASTQAFVDLMAANASQLPFDDDSFDLDLVGALIEVCGSGPDSIELVQDRPGHDVRYALNAQKILTLGWAPEMDIADGLRATVDWYSDRHVWWRPLPGSN